MLRSSSIINAELLNALADARHGDVVVVADAGLPAGDARRVIDLSLRVGEPSFADVAAAILDTLVVESAVVAEEGSECASLESLRLRISMTQVPHEQFKQIAASAHTIVRTGECTPYANVAFVAGVAFPTAGGRPGTPKEEKAP